MVPESVWEEEPKGKYYKFETQKDGRVILKPVRVPSHIMEERRAQLQKKQRRRAAQRNCQRDMVMNRSFVVFVAFALAVCCFFCYLYVSIQSEVLYRVQNISELQVQLEDLISENDILEVRIANRENLVDIQETAGSELGMALAGSDQIIYYTVPDVDYMMQYEDVAGD